MSIDTYMAPMGAHPIRQLHGDPHTEDNYGFWRSLEHLDGVDVNTQVAPVDPEHIDEAHGVVIFCLHGETPASNGYGNIVRADGRVHEMTGEERHRPIHKWAAAQVRKWRRGKTKSSAHPVTLRGALRFLRRHGGRAVIELKSRLFRFAWVCLQAVKACAAEGVAPWFKALANMAFCREKCAGIRSAVARGRHGDFAIIFGKHIRGRGARVRAGRSITANWAVKPTAIW